MVAQKKKTGKKSVGKTKSKAVSEVQKKRISKTLRTVEGKILANYEKAVALSGKDWSKEKKKYVKKVKADVAKVEKRIVSAVKKDPAKAAIVATAVAAIAGAVLMSYLKRRKK